MKFLLEEGFTQELIDKLILKYDEGILDIFQIEKNNVIDNIRYLKQLGIKRLEELILFRIELFTKDPEEIKEAFDKPNWKEIVEEINEDVLYIDKV